MTIQERFLDIMSNKRKTQAGLAAYLNIAKTTVNYWAKSGSSIPSEYLPKICEYLDVTADELVLGKAREESAPVDLKDILNEDEYELIRLYRTLDLEGRTLVLAELYKQRNRLASQGDAESSAVV